MDKRDKAYKLSDHDTFRQLRREISNLLDTAKSNHIGKKLNEAPDARSKWRELNKLGLTKRQHPSPLLFFTPQVLNQHYASISDSNSPLMEQDLQDVIISHPITPNCTSFDFLEVSDADVAKVIQGMKSKSCGVDGISLRMIKLISPTIISSITTVINASLQHGCFPHSWKKALLQALSKKSTPQSPSDTRPIAQLPKLSKILEKIVFMQLMQYLETNHILDTRQAGYRTGHSP